MPEIAIYDVIGEEGLTAKDIKAEIESLGDVSEITVRINSPGGSIGDGLAIFNLLAEHPAKITTIVEGAAASMAAYIAMAGDVRQIAENGVLMVHGSRSETYGNAAEHKQNLAMLETADKAMHGTFVKATGKNPEDITALMAVDSWMDAEQAVIEGFMDSISEPSKVAAKIDVKQFNTMPPRLVALIKPKEAKPMAEIKTPATLKQLEAISKNPEFVLAQLKAEATEAEAQTANAKAMEEEMEEMKAELEAMKAKEAAAMEEEEMEKEAKAKAAAEAEKAAAAKSGVPAISQGEVGATSISATETWKTELAKARSNGLQNAKAVAFVHKNNPGLRQKYIDEVNQ